MGRTVLLRHELPDGSVHFDWMIQVRPGEGLVTFRVQERIDRPGVRRFRAERLPDHREEYLQYEGEVSGGRGRVKRLAEGEVEARRESSEELVCRGRLGKVTGVFRGRGPIWEFEFVPQGGA